MIDRDHELPVSKQCAALGISRGSVYYEPVAVSASDLALMRRLDQLHLEHPHAGRACCGTCWLPREARSAVGMPGR